MICGCEGMRKGCLVVLVVWKLIIWLSVMGLGMKWVMLVVRLVCDIGGILISCCGIELSVW